MKKKYLFPHLIGIFVLTVIFIIIEYTSGYARDFHNSKNPGSSSISDYFEIEITDINESVKQLEVNGALNKSIVEDGEKVELYVTVFNGCEETVKNIHIELMPIDGIRIVEPRNAWPKSLSDGKYVSRSYSLEAERRGVYNLVLSLSYSPNAIQGQTVELTTLKVEQATWFLFPIPRELWVAGITLLWTALSSFLGFTWARWQDKSKQSAVKKSQLEEAYQILSNWLRRSENLLTNGEFPGEIIHKWQEMPFTHPGLWQLLIKSDKQLVSEIGTFFANVQNAEDASLNEFASKAMSLRDIIEMKL